MKKIIALVLAALMMFTVIAPVSAVAADIPDEVVEGIETNIVPVVTEKVNAFTAFLASIKDFVHKIVGTITQFIKVDCPFCENGNHYTGIPSAKITVIENEDAVVNVEGIDYTLDIAYNMQPGSFTKDSEKYADWHADFVIKSDKDVKNLLLAGQYDSYSENYVGLFIDEIKAGQEIRLIETFDKEFADKDIYVNVRELFEDIKSFNCGIYNGEASNIGATITVELRLYETKPAEETEHNTTNEETGVWVTVATVPCMIVSA